MCCIVEYLTCLQHIAEVLHRIRDEIIHLFTIFVDVKRFVIMTDKSQSKKNSLVLAFSYSLVGSIKSVILHLD